MLINSLYSTEKGEIAISRLETTEDKRVILIELWRQKSDSEGLSELLTRSKFDRTLVNNVAKMDSPSPAEVSLKAAGFNSIKTAERFDYAVARATYLSVKSEMRFGVSENCLGWTRLAEQLKKESESTETMAFLQGILAACAEANRTRLVFRSTSWNPQTAAERVGYPEPRSLYPY